MTGASAGCRLPRPIGRPALARSETFGRSLWPWRHASCRFATIQGISSTARDQTACAEHERHAQPPVGDDDLLLALDDRFVLLPRIRAQLLHAPTVRRQVIDQLLRAATFAYFQYVAHGFRSPGSKCRHEGVPATAPGNSGQPPNRNECALRSTLTDNIPPNNYITFLAFI